MQRLVADCGEQQPSRVVVDGRLSQLAHELGTDRYLPASVLRLRRLERSANRRAADPHHRALAVEGQIAYP